MPRCVRVMDHHLNALSELRNAVIPFIGQAASLLTVCSKVRSIADREYCLLVRRIDIASAYKVL